MGRYVYEVIGHVDVDSGTLMIGDPCYFLGEKWTETHYDAMADKFFRGPDGDKPTVSLDHSGGHAGKGVAFGTTWGDGGYPVIAIWDTKADPDFPYVSNRPSQVFVDMDPSYDEETDEYKFPDWFDLKD